MRTSKRDYFLRIAEVVATQATCLRRQVGCVLVNSRNHILATGYNGRAAGLRHCNEPRDFSASLNGTINIVVGAPRDYPYACAGAAAASGTDLNSCEAIHAEQNALLQCRNPWEIVACYVTVSPCVTCVKLLMNTSCRAIYFREAYAHDEPARKLWLMNPERLWLPVTRE